jgi:hypothetical protein
MTAINKWLLISKSHDDSNRCTPCKGKPDQHATCFPRTREEGLPTQSTTRRVDNRLLGLPSPYHRYAIGTFNICSRGPTEWSLIDTGGGYNLRGASLPYTHSPTFPTSCPHFPLVAPPGLHFNQVLTTKPKC